MPVAVVQEWSGGGTSTENYDAIRERLRGGEPVRAMHVHAAGWDGDTFRIFEIWDTREDFDRFIQERLMPILHELPDGNGTPPTTTSYELHDLVTPGDPARVQQ